MITTVVFFGIAFIGWFATRANNRDDYRDEPAAVRHTRQDLRLVVYLLVGLAILLAIIADNSMK